jgi:hypothetical protein
MSAGSFSPHILQDMEDGGNPLIECASRTRRSPNDSRPVVMCMVSVLKLSDSVQSQHLAFGEIQHGFVAWRHVSGNASAKLIKNVNSFSVQLANRSKLFLMSGLSATPCAQVLEHLRQFLSLRKIGGAGDYPCV